MDTSPLLVVNNLKHQRVIDEQKLKVLKWNFTTPREEFVELLKDLMTAANVNKTLRANMFHSDFRYHLKAIEALTEVNIASESIYTHEKINFTLNFIQCDKCFSNIYLYNFCNIIVLHIYIIFIFTEINLFYIKE